MRSAPQRALAANRTDNRTTPLTRCRRPSGFPACALDWKRKGSPVTILAMLEERHRVRFAGYVGKAEIIIYSAVAILLFVTAITATVSAGKLLWQDFAQHLVAFQTLGVLDELLLVLMMVEILHTVRISIRSHLLVTEPFLVVGLIAAIRQILVITLESANLKREGVWIADGLSVFRWNMIELGLLGFLVLILVFSITLLRRSVPAPGDREESWQ